MATPQKIIHGTWAQAWAPLAVVSLFGLGMAHVWEFPFVAARHGGLAFVLAWLLCMAVLALPLRLMEIMLGRRSRRAPVEGLSFLTREADAPRFWRASAWGSVLGAVIGLAGLALLSGWATSFLAHRLVSPAVYTASYAGLSWPLGTGVVITLAAALAWKGMQKLAPVYFALLVVVGLLLAVGAALGSGSAGPVLISFNGAALGAAGWLEAARFALLSLGGGVGLLWLVGAYLPQERSVASLAVPAVLVQIVLTLLAALALSPVVQIAASLPGHSAVLDQLPAAMTSQGLLAWLAFTALALSGLAGLAVLAEVVQRFLGERGIGALPSFVLTFALTALLAEGLWFASAITQAGGLLNLLRALVLLVLLGLSVFSGWAMKISQARKELNLPSEAVYNLWRVAVRLVCPLAIVLVLVGGCFL